ncbi:MAG: hypothetical protein AAFR75_00965, partial [Pseudomonadota bacterium]
MVQHQPQSRSTAADTETHLNAVASASSLTDQFQFEQILKVDDRLRAASDEDDLVHLIANETRKLAGARQVFVLRKLKRARWSVACVSSLALPEKDTPFVRWIEGLVSRIQADGRLNEGLEFSLPAFSNSEDDEVRAYPFPNFYWQPLKLSDGTVFAGLLLARERFWSKADAGFLSRHASVCVSAWKALFGEKLIRPTRRRSRWTGWIVAAVLLALSALPVPMTALAPVEIVGRDPHRVTAPLDGVIDDVLVKPNDKVVSGTALLRYEDTTLTSRLNLADQEMKVARARFERAQQASFSDEAARHELAAL